MDIDFTMSIEDWMKIIQEFIDVIKDFFSWFNIDLFKAEEDTTAAAE